MIGDGMMSRYGQWLTCASCHGPEGRGGAHVMHMRTMTAPDIRYVELRSMSELKGRQRPYDIDDFRQQVVIGRHPDGTDVKADMPRWKMSDSDLADVFSYLKTVPD
jgi:mono/diheme cytochrome c family protein